MPFLRTPFMFIDLLRMLYKKRPDISPLPSRETTGAAEGVILWY
jgi:hypothetical protein